MRRQRTATVLVGLIGCLAGSACREPPAGTAAASGAGGSADTPPNSEGSVAPSEPEPTVVSLRADQVSIGDAEITALRPAEAPGMLDAAMQPTYRYPGLSEALADHAEIVVAADPALTVGALRGISASLPTNAESFELVAGSTKVPVRVAGPKPAAVYLRPRRGRWTLYVDAAVAAEADSLEDAVAELTEIDESKWMGGVALDLPDATTVEAFASAAAVIGDAVVLPIDYAPCLTPPTGMVCIPGGPAIVGYDEGQPEEKPEREIVLSTFYMDTHEVTNAQYDACHEAGACPIRTGRHQNIMKPFVGSDQPAMPMDWRRARAYCNWAGKQLPTEWEWEKAARGPDGDLYPWGSEEPTCDKAVYRECAPFGCTPYPGKSHRWDCNEHATKPVGSFPPGHYGLFEMAGNGYEWTRSAAIESVADCGESCNGRDPLGPCSSAFPCKGHRILKGGSWYWPKHRVRGSHRRLEKIKTGSHRLSMRCSTHNPYLTVYPPRHLTVKREVPQLEPPTEEHAKIFASVVEDPIEDKPMCDAKVREQWGPLQAKGGRSTTTCRDPFPYVMSNEPRGHVWTKYIENLGGAYVGIGSDQNYSYIAQARAQWAWVVDYDPRVYRNHLRLRAFILAAETPEDFVEMFRPENEREALEVLDKAYSDDADVDAGRLRYGFKQTRDKLLPYFEAKMKRLRDHNDFGWLRNAEHYRYIRQLLRQGRMRPIRGDLLAEDGAMIAIGEAARALETPVRIYYTSNAPSSWGGEVTDAYRTNVLGLPFDAWSVVLQTNSRSGFAQRGKWHHNVTWGPFHHDRLRIPGFDTIPKLLEDRIPGDDFDLTLLGLPSDATAPTRSLPQE